MRYADRSTPRGDSGQITVHSHVYLHARLANLGYQVAQAAQPGLRRERRLAVALAEQTQQPAQLGHSLPSALLDRLERFSGGLLARRQHPALGCGLHDDDAQAVRDDVVQFAGDPGPLGRDGAGCPGLLVTLEHFGAVLLARGVLPVRVHDAPHDEAKGEEQQGGTRCRCPGRPARP